MTKPKLFLSIITLLFLNQISLAFEEYHEYKWDSLPNFAPISAEDSLSEEVVIRKLSFYKFENFHNAFLYERHLEHLHVWLNSYEAIERYNKIYIDRDYEYAQIRVIYPDMSVLVIDSPLVHSAVDNITQNSLRYFAIEGLTLGCQVEILIRTVRNLNFFGTYEKLTSAHKVKEYEFRAEIDDDFLVKTFTVNDPDSLLFNLLQESRYSDNKGIRYVVQLENLEGTGIETMSNPLSIMPAIGMKVLAASINLQVMGYYGYASNISFGYSFATDESMGEIFLRAYEQVSPFRYKKMMKDNNLIADNRSDIISNIDNYIKANLELSTEMDYEDKRVNIKEIFAGGKANRHLLLHAYRSMLYLVKIPYEVHFTPGRYAIPPQSNRPMLDNFEHFLIYIPSLERYIDPTDKFARNGIIDASLIGATSLKFESTLEFDEYNFIGLSKIETQESDQTVDSIYHYIEPLSEKPEITHFRSLSGNFIQDVLSYYDDPTDKEREELNQEMIQFYSEKVELTDIQIRNTDKELIGVEPLEVLATFDGSSFVNFAGNVVMVDVGKLIGQQAELYQETDRKLPIEQRFNRTFNRKIEIAIPQGYQIQNLDDILFDVYDTLENDERYMTFTSSYTHENDLLTIEIKEFYNQLILPIEKYPAFRGVINAAADFNKLVIILEKA